MTKEKSYKLIGFAICLTIGIFIGLLSYPFYQIISGITIGRHLETLYAPETNHNATLLKKLNLADINFIVKVDGVKVYTSPDYMGFPDHLYRENLVWDKSGKIVVLELMGKRTFGYNAEEKREITKNELEKYVFYPTPSDTNYAPIRDLTEK